eukprot:XP_019080093.1 PREDICTED: uncharacterized protein LOC109123768 [Vitis vinifera]
MNKTNNFYPGTLQQNQAQYEPIRLARSCGGQSVLLQHFLRPSLAGLGPPRSAGQSPASFPGHGYRYFSLKSREPEFLVATPERLLELISLKAIDISGVSLLVVDGLDTLCKGGYLDMIKSIRQSISRNPHAVVFSERSSCTSVPGVEDLLRGSYCRLPLKGSINNQSACIAQSIHA